MELAADCGRGETFRASDQLDGAGIFCDGCIVGEEGDSFDGSLGDEETVERVFVDGWQGIDGDSVLTEDRQFDISVVDQAATQGTRIDVKVGTLQSSLNGDLPETGYAEEQFVVGIRNKWARAAGDAADALSGP